MNKNEFLNSLISNSANQKYKRCVSSPLRYAGGKSLAVGYVLEQLPDSVSEVVSPFFGGGSVEIALAKNLGLRVKGFDVFDLLVNFWQVVLKHPKELAKELSKISADVNTFRDVKSLLKKHWLGEETIADPIVLAAFYYFNHNTSYGPGFLGWPSSVYMNEKKWLAMIQKIDSFDVPSLTVEHKSFENSISENPRAFIYADPPYFLDGDSKMFKGIYPQRNFPIHHNGFDHQLLRDLLRKHKGGFILSYNDCDQIRDWYADCNISEPVWQYTMGQGETRIGENRKNNNINHIKKSHELLIWKLPDV